MLKWLLEDSLLPEVFVMYSFWSHDGQFLIFQLRFLFARSISSLVSSRYRSITKSPPSHNYRVMQSKTDCLIALSYLHLKSLSERMNPRVHFDLPLQDEPEFLVF